MAKSKIQTERLQVMLAVRAHALLAILAEKGMFGTSVPDVAKALIEQGLRRAKREGFLTEQDVRSGKQSG
jgi:hypothetical protein